MAQLVPDTLPSWVLENPFRSTEVEVYRALGRQLDDRFVAYYSRPWLGLTEQGADREGEADFVIAHPDYGAVVLEVKGGRITRDGTSDRWQSTDRFGIPHDIGNPVGQANRSKHALKDKLRANSRMRGRDLHVGVGVIFPHVQRAGIELGMEMPERLFALADDMAALKPWILERCRAAGNSGEIPALGAEGMEVLRNLLARSFTLHPSLRVALEADDRKISALTQEQYQLLENIESVPKARIAGGAGTGKTLLALEKAHRLAEKGEKVLLVCVSVPLAVHLRELCKGLDGISCFAVRELTQGVDQQAGATRGSPAAEDLASALLAALTRQPGEYDAVILDEAQDTTPDVLQALELALRNPREGTFYIFYDDCQRIAGALAPTPGHGVPLRLGRNLRNTKQIFSVAKAYYRGAIAAHGPVGVAVEWIELPSTGKWPSLVETRIGQLIGREAVPSKDIVILTGSTAGRDTLRSRPALSSHLRLSSPMTGLTIETIGDFKGLERGVAILCDLEAVLDHPETLYVGLTRARVHLIILGTRAQLATVDLGGTRPRSVGT